MMKITKKMFYSIIIIAVSFIFMNQTQTQINKAKAILEKLEKTYSNYSNLTMKFNIYTSGPEIKTTTISGTAYKKSTKYAYDTKDIKIFCDGKTVWTYFKNDNKVNITNADDDDQEMIKPDDLFLLWKKNHKYSYFGKRKLKNITYDIVKLYPTETKDYHTIELMINTKTNSVYAMQFKGKDAANMTYNITSQDSKTVLEDKKFVFDKSNYPGVKENDMRF